MHFTTVTANPCIDRTIQVDSVNLGHSHRVQKTICDFSGKGINVSGVLRELGCESVVLGLSLIHISEPTRPY